MVYGSGLENRRCLKASRSSNLLASAITGVYISWLDSRSDKAKVAGSSPAAPTTYYASYRRHNMQINNVSPAPPKTLTDLSVGDCFTLARLPGKVFILVSKFTENIELYGIVELGADGVSVYTPSPINSF